MNINNKINYGAYLGNVEKNKRNCSNNSNGRPVLSTIDQDTFTSSTKKSSNPIKKPSKLNADFFLVEKIGYTEWAQQNEDGTYTVYGQGSSYDSEPEIKRIIQC